MTATNQMLGVSGDRALGDTHPITIDVYKLGALYSPTVTSAVALFKLTPTADDSAAVITKTLGSGISITGSVVTVTVTPADQATFTATVTLYWAVRIKEASGDQSELASGTLTLTRLPVRTPL
jgi:hypothetical protein